MRKAKAMKDIMGVASCGMSDKGLVRENNEDFYTMDEEIGLYIVADGLGGEEAGELASQLAAETIMTYFRQSYKKNTKAVNSDMINEAIQRAHKAIQDASLKDSSIDRMGTTVVFALKQPSYFWIANVGDSRGYLVRDKRIELVTKDHSLVARLIQEGSITLQEARTHHLRNIVTQSLGIDVSEGCYKRRLDIQKGDVLILCSDGLWDMLTDEEIRTIVLKLTSSTFLSVDAEPAEASRSVQGICKKLVEAANLAGGYDNVTVIAIAIGKR